MSTLWAYSLPWKIRQDRCYILESKISYVVKISYQVIERDEGRGVTVLARVVREGFSEEVRFELRPNEVGSNMGK